MWASLKVDEEKGLESAFEEEEGRREEDQLLELERATDLAWEWTPYGERGSTASHASRGTDELSCRGMLAGCS
jgi:hypothetical protein